MSEHEIVFGTPEYIAGLSRRALEEDFRWVQDRRMELDDECERLDAENAKLRTFLGGGSIVTDYWKDEDGTMHVLTTDGEQTYEYMRGGLAEENAKLLRLLRALALCADDNADCDKCVMNGAVYSSVRQTFCNEMADELRAVGIEVD